jgi:MFS family permease
MTTTWRIGSGGTLAVAAAGTLLTLVAFTLPLTTLTGTAADLGAGPGAQAWVLSAMSLGAAAGLLSSGAIGDEYGRRRTFLAGAMVLAVSSLLGALAPDALVLILARVVQGLGGAAMLACGLGLIGHAFPAGAARARATGVWGAALGAGVALGPFLATGLTAIGGWRLSYLATALAAAVVALAGRALLAESRAAAPRPVDVTGTLLLALGLAAVLAGLVEGRAGWGHPTVLALLAAGLALLVGFVAVERRVAHPLLDLALLRRPDFVGATAAALAAGAGILALSTVVPTLIERGLGGSAVLASVVLLAWSATSVVTALSARWLPPWVSPRAQLVAGLVGCAAGQLALTGLTPGSAVVRLLPGLLVAGAANGVLNAALGLQAVASVPADRAAMGGGANNTARYVGSAIGIAVVAVLVTHAGAAGAAGVVSGWNVATLVTAGVSLLGALAVLLARERRAVTRRVRRGRRARGEGPAGAAAIVSATKEAARLPERAAASRRSIPTWSRSHRPVR